MNRRIAFLLRLSLVLAALGLWAGSAGAQTQDGAPPAIDEEPATRPPETAPAPIGRNTVLLPQILADLFGPGQGGDPAPGGNDAAG
ncbi:hypothetical protein NA2_14822, partial [Nitratireductor pacificus pht-3B]